MQLQHEEQVRGLVLISLVADASSLTERLGDRMGALFSDHRSHLLARWLSSAWMSAHKERADEFGRRADALNRHNVDAFVQAHTAYVLSY